MMTTSLPSDFWGRVFFILQRYGTSYLKGAGTTLLISIVSTIIGCIIGFGVGVVQYIPIDKRSPWYKRALLRVAKVIMKVYVEVFRGTPMMVQSMFIYYGASQLLGINMSMWFAAFFIVSINTGAYMAETVRGGILSVDIGQTEGALAVGMSPLRAMNYVLIPQALRNIMPQIGNNLIINIKDTCVLSVIGTVELFFSAKSVAGTYYTYFESMTIAMVLYLTMTIAASKLLRLWEKKMDGPATYDLATTDTLAFTSGLLNISTKRPANERPL
ncbi:MAG: amino acid ABC transporter permease [Sphaerochaetaceae bacterium]